MSATPAAGRQSVGHPVDVASGTMFGDHLDFSIPGRVPITWRRRYSTALLGRASLVLGPGWRLPLSADLRVEPGRVTFTDPAGTEEVFEDPVGELVRGGVVRHLGSCTELAREGERYVVSCWAFGDTAGATRYVFRPGSTGWQLAAVESADGRALDVVHDSAGRMHEVRQRREGRGVRLAYDSRGLLEAVIGLTRSGSRPVLARYRYDRAGRLVEADDPLGHPARYEYDDQNRIVRETSRAGGAFTFAYDERGRCVLTEGPGGFHRRAIRYMDQLRLTRVTDSHDRVWFYEWTPTGQVAAATSPGGLVTRTEYDEHGRVAATVAPGGRTHRFEYDDAGNRSAVIDPLGRATRYEYNTSRQPVAMTTKNGGVWRRYYGTRGHLLVVENPGGQFWQFTYDNRGDLVEVHDPAGQVTRWEFDEAGQAVRRTDPRGDYAEYWFDELGWLLGARDRTGQETRYVRDLAGRTVRVRWPHGTVIETQYDAAGRPVRTDGPDGQVVTHRYDLCGRLTVFTDPLGRTVRYEWGTEPVELREVHNEKGEVYRYEYDPEGRVVRAVDFAGRQRVNSYGIDGLLREVLDNAGLPTAYRWDAVGNLAGMTAADGAEVVFEHDAMGRVLRAANGSAEVTFERDVLGRITAETCGGVTVGSEFDPRGMRVVRTTTLGDRTCYEFGPTGRLDAVTLGDGGQIGFGGDAFGREVLRRFPNGLERRQSFGASGLLSGQRVAPAAVGTGSGRLDVSDALVERVYEYGPDRNVAGIRDGRWGRTEYDTDACGRLTAVRREAGADETFRYDDAGNIVAASRTDAPAIAGDGPGGALPPRGGSGVREREVGPGNQVLRDGPVRFDYDPNGRMIRRTELAAEGPRVWEYEWDGLGQLAAVVTPAGERWRYEYDPFGRRVAKHGPAGTTRYVWDRDTIAHELPPDGQPVTWTFLPGTFTPLARRVGAETYYVVTDHLGTPRELLDRRGAVAWAGVMTAWGELHRAAGDAPDPGLRFPGQWHDPESGLHYNRFRYYAPDLGVYLSPDPLGLVASLNEYTYVRNPARWTDPLGLAPSPPFIGPPRPLEPFYGTPDELGRPTGANALLSPNDLGTGTEANGNIIPPGFAGGHRYVNGQQVGGHDERGHLLGNLLGGTGDDPRNLATMTCGTNHPHFNRIESKIANHLRNGNYVEVTITPIYDGDDPVASSFRIQARDPANPDALDIDEEVQNGMRKDA